MNVLRFHHGVLLARPIYGRVSSERARCGDRITRTTTTAAWRRIKSTLSHRYSSDGYTENQYIHSTTTLYLEAALNSKTHNSTTWTLPIKRPKASTRLFGVVTARCRPWRSYHNVGAAHPVIKPPTAGSSVSGSTNYFPTLSNAKLAGSNTHSQLKQDRKIVSSTLDSLLTTFSQHLREVESRPGIPPTRYSRGRLRARRLQPLYVSLQGSRSRNLDSSTVPQSTTMQSDTLLAPVQAQSRKKYSHTVRHTISSIRVRRCKGLGNNITRQFGPRRICERKEIITVDTNPLGIPENEVTLQEQTSTEGGQAISKRYRAVLRRDLAIPVMDNASQHARRRKRLRELGVLVPSTKINLTRRYSRKSPVRLVDPTKLITAHKSPYTREMRINYHMTSLGSSYPEYSEKFERVAAISTDIKYLHRVIVQMLNRLVGFYERRGPKKTGTRQTNETNLQMPKSEILKGHQSSLESERVVLWGILHDIGIAFRRRDEDMVEPQYRIFERDYLVDAMLDNYAEAFNTEIRIWCMKSENKCHIPAHILRAVDRLYRIVKDFQHCPAFTSPVTGVSWLRHLRYLLSDDTALLEREYFLSLWPSHCLRYKWLPSLRKIVGEIQSTFRGITSSTPSQCSQTGADRATLVFANIVDMQKFVTTSSSETLRRLAHEDRSGKLACRADDINTRLSKYFERVKRELDKPRIDWMLKMAKRRRKNLISYGSFDGPVVKEKKLISYRSVSNPVVEEKKVTCYRSISDPVVKKKSVLSYRSVSDPVVKKKTVIRYRSVSDPVVKDKNVISYTSVSDLVVKDRQAATGQTRATHIQRRKIFLARTGLYPLDTRLRIRRLNTKSSPRLRIRSLNTKSSPRLRIRRLNTKPSPRLPVRYLNTKSSSRLPVRSFDTKSSPRLRIRRLNTKSSPRLRKRCHGTESSLRIKPSVTEISMVKYRLQSTVEDGKKDKVVVATRYPNSKFFERIRRVKVAERSGQLNVRNVTPLVLSFGKDAVLESGTSLPPPVAIVGKDAAVQIRKVLRPPMTSSEKDASIRNEKYLPTSVASFEKDAALQNRKVLRPPMMRSEKGAFIRRGRFLLSSFESSDDGSKSPDIPIGGIIPRSPASTPLGATPIVLTPLISNSGQVGLSCETAVARGKATRDLVNRDGTLPTGGSLRKSWRAVVQLFRKQLSRSQLVPKHALKNEPLRKCATMDKHDLKQVPKIPNSLDDTNPPGVSKLSDTSKMSSMSSHDTSKPGVIPYTSTESVPQLKVATSIVTVKYETKRANPGHNISRALMQMIIPPATNSSQIFHERAPLKNQVGDLGSPVPEEVGPRTELEEFLESQANGLRDQPQPRATHPTIPTRMGEMTSPIQLSTSSKALPDEKSVNSTLVWQPSEEKVLQRQMSLQPNIAFVTTERRPHTLSRWRGKALCSVHIIETPSKGTIAQLAKKPTLKTPLPTLSPQLSPFRRLILSAPQIARYSSMASRPKGNVVEVGKTSIKPRGLAKQSSHATRRFRLRTANSETTFPADVDTERLSGSLRQLSLASDVLESHEIPPLKFEKTEPDEAAAILPFSIPEAKMHEALASQTSQTPSFWSYTLYRDSEGRKVMRYYCKTLEASEERAATFLDKSLLGFDLEWKEPRKGQPIKERVAVIQLASVDQVAIFHVAMFRGQRPKELLPPSIKKIMEDPNITKAGVGIKGDCTRLRNCFGVESKGLCELSHLHKLLMYSEDNLNLVDRKMVRLAHLVEKHLHLPLFKDIDVRASDWSKSLSIDQIEYAASDAYAAVVLFHVLDNKRQALRPTPPMPYFAESGLSIRLAEEPILLAPKDTADVLEDVIDTVEETTDLADDKTDVSEDTTDYVVDTSDIAETQYNNLYTSAQNLQDNVDSREEDTSQILEESNGTSCFHPSTSVLFTETVKDVGRSFLDPATLVKLELAGNWVKGFRNDRKAVTSPAYLRAYALWHFHAMSIPDIATLLRKPPLLNLTVAQSVLTCIQKEKLPFDEARIEDVFTLIPQSAVNRFSDLRRNVEHKKR